MRVIALSTTPPLSLSLHSETVATAQHTEVFPAELTTHQGPCFGFSDSRLASCWSTWPPLTKVRWLTSELSGMNKMERMWRMWSRGGKEAAPCWACVLGDGGWQVTLDPVPILCLWVFDCWWLPALLTLWHQFKSLATFDWTKKKKLLATITCLVPFWNHKMIKMPTDDTTKVKWHHFANDSFLWHGHSVSSEFWQSC